MSHFAAVLVTGLLFSIGGNRKIEPSPVTPVAGEGKPVMAAFGEAIKKTVLTLWTVGGYIVLFSVLTALLRHYNVLSPVAGLFAPVLRVIGLEPSLAEPLAIGAIEMTNGCNAIANAPASLLNRCAAIAALVSFGGLCIQAQSMLFLSSTGLVFGRFLFAKVVQAAVAFGVCKLLVLLPAFSTVLCMGSLEMPSYSPASALLSSSFYTAGSMLVFALLAFVSGRASTRGSA